MLFLAALALRPSPEEPRSSLQPPRMPTLTHATIAAVESNHTALPIEGGGGMADVLTSVSKNFRPEEAFKSAAEAVQKLPAATKDKVKADVQSIVASLPPELASYMQARAEKLTRVLPEEVRGALRADPSASIGRADELLNKLNETEQAEASTAVQEMLLGAVQFTYSCASGRMLAGTEAQMSLTVTELLPLMYMRAGRQVLGNLDGMRLYAIFLKPCFQGRAICRHDHDFWCGYGCGVAFELLFDAVESWEEESKGLATPSLRYRDEVGPCQRERPGHGLRRRRLGEALLGEFLFTRGIERAFLEGDDGHRLASAELDGVLLGEGGEGRFRRFGALRLW